MEAQPGSLCAWLRACDVDEEAVDLALAMGLEKVRAPASRHLSVTSIVHSLSFVSLVCVPIWSYCSSKWCLHDIWKDQPQTG